MVKEEKKNFEVKLFCRNCDHQWIEEIDRGIYVRSEKDNNYMINKDDVNSKKKGVKKYFVCPNCGANKKIARLPMRDFRG